MVRRVVLVALLVAACGSKNGANCELGAELAPCALPSECCSNLCVGGSCGATGACTENGDGCDDGTTCCSGTCPAGTCEPATCQGIGAACTLPTTCCTGACNGGQCVDGGGCRAIAEACIDAADCCSGRCQGGVCLPAGACIAPGAECMPGATNECCSSRCEPVQGMAGVTQCTDFCRGNGATCTKATDCCDLNCNGGVCGGEICHVESDGCNGNAQCCSNICTGGECQLDPANTECRGIGETCNSGPQMGCCSMVCDETQAPPRCDFGEGTCGAQNASCTTDADCCHGICDPLTMLCTTPCADTGQPCMTGSACCSSVCTNGACQAPPDCLPLGTGCTLDAECCSGLCIGGFCDQIIIE